jgi:membrane protein
VKRSARDYWSRSRAFLREDLWTSEPRPGSLYGRVHGLLQFAVMTAEGFVRDHLLLRASALSYFTVLSLIPMLAVAIAVASAVGASEDLADLIVRHFLAAVPEAQDRILAGVRQVNFGRLGTVGAVALFVTTVLGVSNIERDLNAIWGVRQQRTLARRFADYLAVLVVAPLLLAAALSLTTTLQTQWLVQRLFEYRLISLMYDTGLRHAPTVVLMIAFAFLYWFLPNTRVRPSAALLGGLVAGILVAIAQSLYLGLNVGVARASAVFGGFIALPLLFVWIYTFWAIVLFGAELAFAYDNLPLYRREVHGRAATPAEREAIGLRIAVEVARTFRDGGAAWSADALATALGVPVRTVRDVLADLERTGIVTERGAVEKEGGFQLGRPAERIPVTEVIGALRGEREPSAGDPLVSSAVAAVLEDLEEGAEKSAAGRTLADLLTPLPERARGNT